MNRILYPEFWVLIFSLLAIIGIVFLVTGYIADVPWFQVIGLALGTPLVATGILLIFIVIPFLVIDNIRNARRQDCREDKVNQSS